MEIVEPNKKIDAEIDAEMQRIDWLLNDGKNFQNKQAATELRKHAVL